VTKKFKNLREFTTAQMARLKKEYEPLKGKTMSMDQIKKMNSILNTYSVDMLMKLAKGDVPFLSTSAKSKLVIKHGKKWTDFKEPLDMAEADELQQEACWVGYRKDGMKKKGDRMVPNCVKEELVESMDDDCPTCNGGECQCTNEMTVKVCEDCGGEECICVSLEEAFKTGDWTSFDVSVNEMMEAHQGQGLPPHLAKLFNKDGNFKDPKTQKKYQDMIDRQGKKNFKITDVTPKGYGPKEGLDKEDEKSVDDVVKQLKKAVKAHQGQVKSLTKDLKDEADLSKTQIKMVHKKADDLPKSDFIKRYGKDGDSVRFATATNMVKKKLGVAENLIKGENEMNESYKGNFKAAMEELGINSLDELKSVEEQKAFFSYVDSLEEGLTAGQKKLPPALQKSILAKQGDKKEELSDKQKKMDMNKNGKIDGEDLAKLRTKKEQADSPAQQAAIAISKKEKEMKELKAETDPTKVETMKKEIMNAMNKMPEMADMSSEMKKEMMEIMKKKMNEYGSMNITAMKEMAEMKPMNATKMNAMTDPKKMNAMHSQDPRQDMIKKNSEDDIRAMKTMEMDMAKNNDDTETPSMETMKAAMMKKDETMKKETAKKRMNAMKDANPMYAMKTAGMEMMKAMREVQKGKQNIKGMYGEKYLPTKEGSLEAAVLKSVSTKKTD